MMNKRISDIAAERLREISLYLHDHAEAIIGDIESAPVAENGIRINFTLTPTAPATVNVTKRHIVPIDAEYDYELYDGDPTEEDDNIQMMKGLF